MRHFPFRQKSYKSKKTLTPKVPRMTCIHKPYTSGCGSGAQIHQRAQPCNPGEFQPLDGGDGWLYSVISLVYEARMS